MLEILTDKGVRSNVKEIRQKKRSLCNGSASGYVMEVFGWIPPRRAGGVDRGVFLTEAFI